MKTEYSVEELLNREPKTKDLVSRQVDLGLRLFYCLSLIATLRQTTTLPTIVSTFP